MGLKIEIYHKLTCDSCGADIESWRTGIIKVSELPSTHGYGYFLTFDQVPMRQILNLKPGQETNEKLLHDNFLCLESFLKNQVLKIHHWIKERAQENEPSTEVTRPDLSEEEFTEGLQEAISGRVRPSNIPF